MKIKNESYFVTTDNVIITINEQPLTMKDVIIKALLATYSNEDIDGNEKNRRYKIAMKVKNSEEYSELLIEEVVIIKELIGKFWSPIVVGQAYSLLEDN